VGVSASSISQIELSRVAPSVSTLYALTNALSVSMDSLFVEEDSGDAGDAAAGPAEGHLGTAATPSVVPGQPATAHERSIIQRRDHRRAINLQKGVRWELLTPFPEPGAEFLEVRYQAGGGSGDTDEAIRHNGRDYCLILEGSLSVQIGFEQYALGPGDSLAFDATIPHRFWNAGDAAVRAVWFVLDRWPPHG
jgi:transcriptional regulator with XRE-family HTH domain